MNLRRGVVVAGVAVLLAAGCGGSSRSKGPPALLFVSTKDGDYAVYGANEKGKHSYVLTEHDADGSTPEGLFFQNDPAWSDDGTKIAFTSNRDGKTHIFVMNADGSGTRRVTNSSHSDDHPSWSPDGRWIVFAREGALYKVRSTGGAVTRVGRGPGAAADPAWSPDGNLIAYDYRRPGYSIKEIYVMRPDGTGIRQVTALRDVSTYPAWSPDGKTIAFASTVFGAKSDIYTTPLSGAKTTRKTDVQTTAIQPAWTPDGKGITYSDDGAIVTTEDGKTTKLTSGKDNDSAPAWRPVQ